jgi:RNA polymerase I-specific transcription initiation factor RRN7
MQFSFCASRSSINSRKVYRGAEALQLYLQVYQLILRKQCWVLVHTFQLPAEIEMVVKDLWELRVHFLENRLDTGADAEAVFSSQQQSDREESNDHQARKKWETRGKETPGVLESLCLNYMAASILRLPVSIGDLHRYSDGCLKLNSPS